MFGYFRFNQLYATSKQKNIYKNYYCGTCFALEYNYGEIARFTLSYDVVILALIAKIYDNPNRAVLPCFLKKNEKEQFVQNEDWQKIAAINILLMKAKFDDDINDEKTSKSKAVALLFHEAIKKAEKQFPNLALIIKEGYKTMYKLETERTDILNICNAFADMMEKVVVTAFNVSPIKIEFVKGISRWLYFIDQLDDYDKDIKEGKYNPLVSKDISKYQMINKDNTYLFEVLREIFKDYHKIKKGLNLSCDEDCLLYAVINESIPNVTSSILSGRRLPQIMHRKKELEWKE